MIKLNTIRAASLFLLLAAGCNKSNSGTTNSPNSFPKTIGDSWLYLVKDTTVQGNVITGTTQYNVDVQIVGSVKWSNGITAAIWQYQYPGSTDSNYVYQTGDTIRFTDRTNTTIVRQYILPFASGSSWPYVPGIGKVTVAGPHAKTVGNNVYDSAWQIFGPAGIPDAIFTVDEWYKDNIGFVNLYINPSGELINIKHFQEWSLVSYQIK
jgi:hypothetical protein